MSRLMLGCVVAGLASGCLLRPLYKDVVAKDAKGSELLLVLKDPRTSKPLPAVRLEMSEYKNRYAVTTAADGTFKLPIDKKYFDENPIIVVNLPPGVEQYSIAVAPVPAPVPAPAPPAPKEEAPAVDAPAAPPAAAAPTSL